MTKKLPIAGRTTSAASTSFCGVRLEGPGGLHLWIDGNGKVTAGNGTLENPSPNALSTVQIKDCPGRTPSCERACYVHGLERHAPATHDLYKHNSSELRRILMGPGDCAWWEGRLGAWIRDNAAGGFRWHVSGDVFSADYARFIVNVCKFSRDVDHWIYTRSFDYVPILTQAPNLAVNLSGDSDNIEAALRCHRANPRTRLTYLTVDGHVPDLPPRSVVFPDYGLRANGGPAQARAGSEWWDSLTPEQKRGLCPADFYGKSEGRRCGPCRKCIDVPVPGGDASGA